MHYLYKLELVNLAPDFLTKPENKSGPDMYYLHKL